MKKEKSTALVYSSDVGRICPSCEKAVKECVCKLKIAPKKSDGFVRVSRSTKGRGGKEVTCIVGVPLNTNELNLLAKELKQRCGTGGTVKDDIIEIQGNHIEVLIKELQKKGYQVKRAGG